MSNSGKRRDTDVVKLMMNNFKVELIEDQLSEFYVDFQGPKDSPYENGVWRIHVELPETYPYKSPSIGFTNKIYHPNVDEKAGSICLDVINQTWSPIFDLVNIFETFLPQLLLYPNPQDPLNSEAAVLMLKDQEAYKKKVKGSSLSSNQKEKSTINKQSEQKEESTQQQDQDMEDDNESGGFLTDEDED